MDESKNIRLRELVRKLNHSRRTQKKQIDILCNDILTAHGDFINHLRNFRFAADFFENLLDARNLDSLGRSVGEFLNENINNCSVAVVFTSSGSPEVHFYSKDPQLEDLPSQLTPHLTTKLVESVCQSSRICRSDELCRMDFFAGPAVLKRLSLAAVGLNNSGPALGMLLVYRNADEPLNSAELAQISSVVKGLCRAVKSIRGTTTCDSYA